MNNAIRYLNEKMRETNLNLMRDVFIKWDKIYKRIGFDKGVSNCSLCKEYYFWNCFRCPIYKFTGQKDCEGTPYIEWQNHWFTKHSKNVNIRNQGNGSEILCSECKDLVYKEIDFLWKVYCDIKNGKISYNE
jgi:hypothetical protein